MSTRPDICRICEAKTQTGSEDSFTVRAICDRCGTYLWRFSSDFAGLLLRPEDKAKLAGYVRTQNSAGIAPVLDRGEVERIISTPLPHLRERADLGLRYLASKNTELELHKTETGFYSHVHDGATFQAVTYSQDSETARHVLEVLRDDGLIEWNGYAHQVKSKGRLRAEELTTTKGQGTQAFVAMCFKPELDEAYARGFFVGIESAGYRPLRIDQKEHIRGISDEILAEIRNSKFVVVDYTLQNQGVYFEAGFALGLGLPLIPTCRANEIGKLHFDIRHINTVLWNDPADLSEKLSRRILAVLGRGPLS